MTFQVKVVPSADFPSNGFLAFGDGPNDRELVKCGLFVGGSYAAVYEGTYPSTDLAKQTMPLPPRETYELAVRVDLARQTVEMTVGDRRIVKKLSRNVPSIRYYGYCVITTKTHFGPIEITRQKGGRSSFLRKELGSLFSLRLGPAGCDDRQPLAGL